MFMSPVVFFFNSRKECVKTRKAMEQEVLKIIHLFNPHI